MALAHQFNYLNVQIGTVDFTSYLANSEQVASVPIGSEVGRATLTFRDDGTLPAIQEWGTVVIKAGTVAPGTVVWGGFATRQSSEPVSMDGGAVRLVTVDCQSYSIRLATTEPIHETYGGGNNESILMDYVIVDDLVSTYLPAFYDAGLISSTSPVQCDYIQFSHETLRSALNKVVERSAKEFGITAGADFYYRPTGSLGALDHILTEDPDYDEMFPMQAKPYFDDDAVELRNAVRVLGGWTVSAIQTESFLTDGIAYSFQVDYFPQQIISVTLANVPQTVGVYLVDDPADFDCLVHYDQRKFYYQLPPSAGKTLEIVYRYPVRVQEDVLDSASIAAVGGTLWGPAIVDSSISDGTVAQRIGSAYLAGATASIERGQITTSWVGTAALYLPGHIVKVTATALGWESNQLEIQAVTMRFAPRPGGVGSCLTYWDMDVGSPLSVGRSMGESFINAPETTNWKEAPQIERGLTEGDIPTLDHGTGLSGLADDDHTQYLLATGTRAGASSQAQTFTNGIIGPSWKPASDSTTALQMRNAGGTAVFTLDTTNSRVVLASGVPLFVGSDRFLHNYGTTNLFAGIEAGNLTLSTAYDNVAVGYRSLQSLTTGYHNVAIGREALPATTSGQDNVGLGTYALRANTDGFGNFALGYYSLAANVHGIYNVAVGMGALQTFNPADASGRNIAIGAGALVAATTGINNVAIGTTTGYTLTTGYGNIFLGHAAGMYETGSNKLFVNSQWTGTEAADRLAAIIYGEMSSTVASQILRTNAQLQVMRASSTTNAVDTVAILAHNTSGTAAANFGSGLLFTLESSTTADQNAALITSSWIVATHASRTARLALAAYDYNGAREGLRIDTNGSAALLGLYGAAAVAQATTSVAAASFTANSGTAVNDASTFDGYTIKQMAKALRNLGVLA